MPLATYLTSSPCLYPPPPGTPAPFLMHEANGFLALLKSDVPSDTHMLMIASDPENTAFNDQMREDFERGMRASVFDGLQAFMLDERNPDALETYLRSCALVMLCGGHVPTQHRFFEALHLREALAHYPGTVMGISAGSMNAARTVYAQPEFPGESTDPAYVRYHPGLDLTDIHIIPHMNQERYNILDGKRLYEDITFPDSSVMPLLAIPDGSFVRVCNGHSTLYGEGWLIYKGIMTRICESGQTCKLTSRGFPDGVPSFI